MGGEGFVKTNHENEFLKEAYRVLIRTPDTPLSENYYWAGSDVRDLSIFILQWKAYEMRRMCGQNTLRCERRCFYWVVQIIRKCTHTSRREARSFVNAWLAANEALIFDMQLIVARNPNNNYFF